MINKFFSNVKNFFSKQYNIVMLGLDCSGKTTMLYQIKDLSQVMMTVPKIGFCLEILEFENYYYAYVR